MISDWSMRLIEENGQKTESQEAVQLSRYDENSSPFPVAMTKGSHLFPYRTQKLSPSVPMVLGWKRPGRVGRRRIPYQTACTQAVFSVGETGGYWYNIKNAETTGGRLMHSIRRQFPDRRMTAKNHFFSCVLRRACGYAPLQRRGASTGT